VATTTATATAATWPLCSSPLPLSPSPKWPRLGSPTSWASTIRLSTRPTSWRARPSTASRRSAAPRPRRNCWPRTALRPTSWPRSAGCLPLKGFVEPEIGMIVSARWKAEQYARSWTAKEGVQGGIKITTDFSSPWWRGAAHALLSAWASPTSHRRASGF
jgi:hypothetical protein